VQLFLKGDRCDTVKCAVKKREKVPGMHEFRRMKHTDYGMKLREKQKVKRYYGLTERQFQRVFREAARREGNTGETLLVLLERRLDNVAYLLGFASSRNTVRQMISHGNLRVNGRTWHPFGLSTWGTSFLRRASPKNDPQGLRGAGEARPRAPCDDANLPAFERPPRGRTSADVNEQLIVEFCSPWGNHGAARRRGPLPPGRRPRRNDGTGRSRMRIRWRTWVADEGRRSATRTDTYAKFTPSRSEGLRRAVGNGIRRVLLPRSRARRSRRSHQGAKHSSARGHQGDVTDIVRRSSA
jgi:small subunit ribosomal protein S4